VVPTLQSTHILSGFSSSVWRSGANWTTLRKKEQYTMKNAVLDVVFARFWINSTELEFLNSLWGLGTEEE
jgi:hypothetical protein